MRAEYKTETNRTEKRKMCSFQKGQSGYYYESALYLWCFSRLLRHRWWGHNVEKKEGQSSSPRDWNDSELSPFKASDVLHVVSRETSRDHFSQWTRPWNSPAVSRQPEVTDLMSRQGLHHGLDLSCSLPLNIPNSAQTDMVSNTWLLLKITVLYLTSTPSSTPSHDSSTGNSRGCYTTVGCLQHNTAINFLKLGPL